MNYTTILHYVKKNTERKMIKPISFDLARQVGTEVGDIIEVCVSFATYLNSFLGQDPTSI